MPVDVAAEVLTNRPLSADYNVLALRAPEIARVAAPGQFVMVKAGLGHDPLLRRPFSVFEILRDRDGSPSGLSLLNKRIGPSTALVYDAAARAARRLPGTARPSVLARRATDRGVDGRRRRRAGAVRSRWPSRFARAACARTLFYGARRAEELFCLNLFQRSRRRADAHHRGRQRGRARPRHGAARAAALRPAPAAAPVMIYACGPEGMLAADGARSRCATDARARCRSSASWDAGWAAATVASSRCAPIAGASTTCDRA